MTTIVEWLKNHSHAILGTIVFLQNSHLLGVKATGILSVISNLFSAMSGT